jgi:hypothetical protein
MAGGEPSQVEVLREALRSFALDVHTSIPGRVERYDAAKQVADVLPMIRRAVPKADGSYTYETLPVLPSVPVAWTRGGGYYMHFPLAPGDFVWLNFSEVGTAHWRETGDVSPPGDLTRHSLSYPVAHPVVAPVADAFADAPSGEAVLVVPPGGSLRVSQEGAGGTAQPVMTADAFLTVLQAACTAAGAATVAVGAGGAGAAFTAFIGAFANAGLISSSKLKAQFP